ncbi:MAG: HAMP domain-containing histidine kinase [Clostridia bacterium]|nr:HAMP domain-containing histidine kinase [Clostridia bacterium]
MRNAPRRKTSSIKGYLIFFCTVATTVTIALMLFMPVYERTEGNRWILAITMLLIIVALSAIGTGADLLRRKIMIDRPVQEILSATEKIAAGDFSTRLTTIHSYEKYDDYDLIKENLNAMAAELEKSETLHVDFVSNISHELKTPLAIIQNYVGLLQRETDAEKRSKYTQTIVDATKRLTNLIHNVLKLNKLENQGLRYEYERVRLHDSLAESVLGFEDLLEKKSIELVCDLDEVEITSVPSCLEIVWNNLLSNAIKFTNAGGRVAITLKKQGVNAVVTVSDTGCGISPEAGARIFDKFYQGDTSHSQEGNGLGLALVKKVIDVLGGEISVKSELGKGSAFTVVLKELER